MTTAKAIAGSAVALMDELLDAEHAAFTEVDAACQRVADATAERIIVADRLSQARLARADLLPDDDWLTRLVLPPIADLIALARERALTVSEQQLRHMARRLRLDPELPRRAVTVARETAVAIEADTYTATHRTLTVAAAEIRGAINEQRRQWRARHEPTSALIARCASANRVGLPGATRGVVWTLRPRMQAAARTASVETANSVLLAGMRGFNDDAG